MLSPIQANIGRNVLLDSRLALFHQEQRWLAVADLHFGYELSQRAAGRLVPFWGMQPIEERLFALLHDYAPKHLVLVGDLVHDRAAATELMGLLAKLRAVCDVLAISGNHDRQLVSTARLVDSWQSPGFHFHHGHCAPEQSERLQIIGHHHPAATLTDGAGLRLKFPALVQQSNCWILPAFSPWASGAIWHPEADTPIWLCTPKRILRLREQEVAPA